MKTLLFALAISFGLGAHAASACDCQKNQQDKKQCACGAGQSCPGECNHDADPPKKQKKDGKKG